MPHGTCVTHVPWGMPGSLTSGGGENAPGIPGAFTAHNFTCLVRGPWICRFVDSRRPDNVVTKEDMFSFDVADELWRVLRKSAGLFPALHRTILWSNRFVSERDRSVNQSKGLNMALCLLVSWHIYFKASFHKQIPSTWKISNNKHRLWRMPPLDTTWFLLRFCVVW